MKDLFCFFNYRLLIIATLAVGGLYPARADISIAGFLQDLTTRTEEIATAPVLHSTDNYVLEEYLNVMVIQNPELREIGRVQPDGTMLKAVASSGYTAQNRNVSSDSWFTAVSLTREPYCGLLSDKRGTALLLRAWPLLEPGSGKKVLGITYVKIDINKFIQSVSQSKNEPLEVLYNTTPVFRRNWTGIRTILEDSFTFSSSDKFVIRYTEPQIQLPAQKTGSPVPLSVSPTITATPPPSTQTASPTIDPLSSAQALVQQEVMPENAALPIITGQDQDTTEVSEPQNTGTEPVHETISDGGIAPSATNNVAESANAATLQSWLSTDSILTAGYVGSSDKQVVLLILLFTGLGFVVVFIIATIMIRRARRRRAEEKERDAMFKPDPIPAIIADKDTKMMDKEETRLMDKEDTRLIEKIPAVRPGFSGEQLDETSLAERETRELPALREFMDDFIKKIHELSLESNINQRNRVFEEINDDLNVWARSEIKQLSGRLGLLLQAIRECESKDGNSAELQVLRYEVMRIIKEVEDVQERLPQRNSVLIVS